MFPTILNGGAENEDSLARRTTLDTLLENAWY